jgi:hypothetical protein
MGGAGLEPATKVAALFHVHASKVTRLVIHRDHERTLADLGFTSETGSA